MAVVYGWLVYAVAAAGLLFWTWWWSRRWPGWLRGPIRVLALAVLCTPAPGGAGFEQSTAPAFMVLAMEALFVPGGEPAEAAARLGVALLLASVLVALVGLIGRHRRRSATAGA